MEGKHELPEWISIYQLTSRPVSASLYTQGMTVFLLHTEVALSLLPIVSTSPPIGYFVALVHGIDFERMQPYLQLAIKAVIGNRFFSIPL